MFYIFFGFHLRCLGSPQRFGALHSSSPSLARRVAKVALGDESGEGGGVGAAVVWPVN